MGNTYLNTYFKTYVRQKTGRKKHSKNHAGWQNEFSGNSARRNDAGIGLEGETEGCSEKNQGRGGDKGLAEKVICSINI